MWTAEDMVTLKVITKALFSQMKQDLPKSCYHVKGHGGLKKAVQKTYEALPDYTHVLRSDIKQYYESIRIDKLMQIIDRSVKNPILTQLICKALHRTETFGGNFYDFYHKGIATRCPLSPLLSAIALIPLDQAMEKIPGIFYARFVDDWVVLTKSKTMLRKVIKKTHDILNTLQLEMHPTKTYIGKVTAGFNFLTYYMHPDMILPSKESIRRCTERLVAFYEHPPTTRSRRYYAPERDPSEYHVNESPPSDDDLQTLLTTVMGMMGKRHDLARRLQLKLKQWARWLMQGLKDCEDFDGCVNAILPTLAGLWNKGEVFPLLLSSIS